MKLNRGFPFAPRLAEPIAMALMGAGFFIFFCALAGGDFWSGLDQRFWRGGSVFSGNSGLNALVIQGADPKVRSATAAQRRLSLARDLDLLAAAGAKVVVLEAWLDDASQSEAELLLDGLLANQNKSADKFRQSVSMLKESLNADRTLANSISKAANVLLPVLLESAPAEAVLTEWPWRGAYQVSLYGKGVQSLEWRWRPSRAPLGSFETASAGLAALSGQGTETSEYEEVPGVFQVGKSWINSVALEAASRQLDIPPKGLHFLWDAGRLSALELKAARYPFNSRGAFRLPPERDRSRLQEVKVLSLSNAPQLLSDVKGKVIFYRPWPELLSGAEAFQRQRDLFAALATRKVQMAPASQHDLVIWCLAFLVTFACLAFFRSRFAWLAPFALALLSVEQFFYGQRPFARVLGCLAGACLAGLGARGLSALRRRKAGADKLRGFVDPSALAFWESLLENMGVGTRIIAGAYVAVESAEALAPALWESWAKRHGAFVDQDAVCQWGFVLPVSGDAEAALEAVKELVRLLPKSSISFALGQIQMSPALLLSSIHWSVESDAKTEAVQMAELASAGELLITESDYADLRDKVKVQLKGELKGKNSARTPKILNVLWVD